MQLQFLEMCGASTVQMTAGEIYQAMQTGTIDAFCLTDGTFVSQKLFEVTDYATLIPFMKPRVAPAKMTTMTGISTLPVLVM